MLVKGHLQTQSSSLRVMVSFTMQSCVYQEPRKGYTAELSSGEAHSQSKLPLWLKHRARLEKKGKRSGRQQGERWLAYYQVCC